MSSTIRLGTCRKDAQYRSTIARPIRRSDRTSGRFSRREMVGCEHSSRSDGARSARVWMICSGSLAMGQFGGAWAGRVIQGPAVSGAPWMSGIEQLAEMITTDLEQRLPGQRKTQRGKLALLVATMLDPCGRTLGRPTAKLVWRSLLMARIA